jgi:hypothetical protein
MLEAIRLRTRAPPHDVKGRGRLLSFRAPAGDWDRLDDVAKSQLVWLRHGHTTNGTGASVLGRLTVMFRYEAKPMQGPPSTDKPPQARATLTALHEVSTCGQKPSCESEVHAKYGWAVS